MSQLIASERKAAHEMYRGLPPVGWNNGLHAVVGLFALKRLSDVYLENMAIVQLQQPGVNVDNPGHMPLYIPPESRWDSLRATGDLTAAVDGLEKWNHCLHGRFNAFDFDSTFSSPTEVKEALQHLDALDFSNKLLSTPDLLGSVYEELKLEFHPKKGGDRGEFFTPTRVVELMVGLTGVQVGETINDPCCGSGRMLIVSAWQLRQEHMKDGIIPPPALFVGNDIAHFGPCIAQISLACLGYLNALFTTQDALRNPPLAKDAAQTLHERHEFYAAREARWLLQNATP